MRIFIEGQEAWLEPGGEAMVIISKFLLVPAFIAFGCPKPFVPGAERQDA